MAMNIQTIACLAFLFSVGALMQILACAIYQNWWPLLTVLMYIMVPMPCLFFGGGSVDSMSSSDGDPWADAAKFLTGFSGVGSIAIPAILHHAGLIKAGAMLMEFASFFILLFTVLLFNRISRNDEF